MKWKEERDLLIAQTMAFVQSVTAKVTEAESRVEPFPLDEPFPPDEPAKVERPLKAVVHPAPAHYSNFREEIMGRIAAFRAHQELFNRDRVEYCNSILSKVRAATARPSNAPEDQPIKR
jgi:hypothetical protein